jgi:predicted dehydrogenase
LIAAATFSRSSKRRTCSVIDVEVNTHVSGSIEFVNRAIATIIASFDVWDSELLHLEIYGTKGTICIRDTDPVDGPNLFGGSVLVRDIANYRWKGLTHPRPYPEWREMAAD